MILANEARRRAARRPRGARRSTACTSGRTRSRSRCCSRSLADLGVPTPPAPERMGADGRGGSRRRGQRAGAPSTSSAVGPRARGVPAARPPGAQAGALRPAQPRPLRASRARAYCHFTSPIRRYPDLVVHRALLRELGVSDEPLPGGPRRARRARARCASAHAAELEYRADEICLAWLLERRLFELGWERPFEGEITGVIAVGPLRPLRRRLRGLRAGAAPARRLLRAERARDCARRPPRRAHLPPRRSDRGARRGRSPQRRQGRARAAPDRSRFTQRDPTRGARSPPPAVSVARNAHVYAPM
mgnify:CR=1 FL=1